MKRWADTLSIVVSLWLASNCVGLQAETQAADEADVQASSTEVGANLAASVKQIFRTRCFECHGTARREADLNVLEHDSLVGEGKSIQPFNLSDSILYDYIVSEDEDFRMPESPRPPLSQQEIESIRKWIEAGLRSFRKMSIPPSMTRRVALQPMPPVWNTCCPAFQSSWI